GAVGRVGQIRLARGGVVTKVGGHRLLVRSRTEARGYLLYVPRVRPVPHTPGAVPTGSLRTPPPAVRGGRPFVARWRGERGVDARGGLIRCAPRRFVAEGAWAGRAQRIAANPLPTQGDRAIWFVARSVFAQRILSAGGCDRGGRLVRSAVDSRSLCPAATHSR